LFTGQIEPGTPNKLEASRLLHQTTHKTPYTHRKFTVEETSVEAPEINADENSPGRGKRVKWLNSKDAGAFWNCIEG